MVLDGKWDFGILGKSYFADSVKMRSGFDKFKIVGSVACFIYP